MIEFFLLALLSGQAQAPTSVEGPAPPAKSPETSGLNEAPTQLYVRGLPEETLLHDLELRSPDVSLEVAAGSTAPADTTATIILIRPRGELFALTVILSDGRAYDREVRASPEQAPRTVASALANLLAAISEERVSADRREVDAAAELAADERDDSTSDAGDPPEATAAPPRPEDDGETGLGTDDPRPTEDNPVEPNIAPSKPPATWTLGPELIPKALLALDQEPELPTFGGAGLDLALVARSPRGLRLGADVRGLWRSVDEVTLQRTRASLIGGYGYRRGRFALTTDVLLSVEPWQLREEGERLDIANADSEEDFESTVMLGFGLRLTPAYELGLGPQSRARLRLGATAEISYAGVVHEGLRAVNLEPEEDGPLFRVGGVELALGALIGLRFDLRPRGSRGGPR